MPRRRARLSLRTLAPSPGKSLGLINPRWLTYIDFLRRIRKGAEKAKSFLDKMDVLSRKMDEILKDWRSMNQRLTRLEYDLGSHVFPWGQTDPQTPRSTSARRAPLRQYKRFMGIAVLFLQTEFFPIRCVLPASVMTAPDLRHPLVQGRMPW